jgi:solute carrier family 35 protein E3
MTNKSIFQHRKFEFATTVTVIHFLFTYIGLEGCAYFGIFKKKKLNYGEVLPLSVAFCSFVVLTNISLQYNSVGFYQVLKTSNHVKMAKVLTTPTIVIIQSTLFNVKFSAILKLSLLVTCMGVGVVSVTDFQLNLVGAIVALAGVLAGSFYQIWVGTKQKELGVNSMQLLYYQSFISMLILTVCIPLIDNARELIKYQHTTSSIFWILLSACLAFFVNLYFTPRLMF